MATRIARDMGLASLVRDRARVVLASHQSLDAWNAAHAIGLKVEDDLRRKKHAVVPRVPTRRMRQAADRLRTADPGASLDTLWAVMLAAAEG